MWNSTTEDKTLAKLSHTIKGKGQMELDTTYDPSSSRTKTKAYVSNGNPYCCIIASNTKEWVALQSIRAVTEPDEFDLKKKVIG